MHDRHDARHGLDAAYVIGMQRCLQRRKFTLLPVQRELCQFFLEPVEQAVFGTSHRGQPVIGLPDRVVQRPVRGGTGDGVEELQVCLTTSAAALVDSSSAGACGTNATPISQAIRNRRSIQSYRSRNSTSVSSGT